MFDEDHFLLVVLKHRYVLNYYVYRAACFAERSPEQNIKPSAYFSFVNGIFSKCFIYITVIIRTALFPSLN